jgi:hypothetical protein
MCLHLLLLKCLYFGDLFELYDDARKKKKKK